MGHTCPMTLKPNYTLQRQMQLFFLLQSTSFVRNLGGNGAFSTVSAILCQAGSDGAAQITQSFSCL